MNNIGREVWNLALERPRMWSLKVESPAFFFLSGAEASISTLLPDGYFHLISPAQVAVGSCRFLSDLRWPAATLGRPMSFFPGSNQKPDTLALFKGYPPDVSFTLMCLQCWACSGQVQLRGELTRNGARRNQSPSICEPIRTLLHTCKDERFPWSRTIKKEPASWATRGFPAASARVACFDSASKVDEMCLHRFSSICNSVGMLSPVSHQHANLAHRS